MNRAPHLWTRRPKIIEPRDALLLRPTLAGWYKLEAIRPDGRRRLVADWFPNLITDVGLNIPGTSSSWVQSCVVGTGNATPTNSDTALASQVGSTSSRTENVGASNQTADRYTYARVTFRFNAGVATGNLAEIGIIGPSIMLSRALILDGGGSPTTITILADEVLDATYEIRTYPPLVDLVTTMDVGVTTHDITVRASEVDSLWDMFGGGLGIPVGWQAGVATGGARVYPSTSVIGTVLTGPSGSGSGDTSGANNTYTTNTHFRDFSYTWGLSAGNVSGGIAAAQIQCGSQPSGAGEATRGQCYQMSIDPVIPKNSGNNLVLQFRQAWARRSI